MKRSNIFREKVETFLDTRHAGTAAKFLIGVILQLVMSAKLNMRANDYGDSVYVGVQEFLRKNKDILVKQVCVITGSFLKNRAFPCLFFFIFFFFNSE